MDKRLIMLIIFGATVMSPFAVAKVPEATELPIIGSLAVACHMRNQAWADKVLQAAALQTLPSLPSPDSSGYVAAQIKIGVALGFAFDDGPFLHQTFGPRTCGILRGKGVLASVDKTAAIMTKGMDHQVIDPTNAALPLSEAAAKAAWPEVLAEIAYRCHFRPKSWVENADAITVGAIDATIPKNIGSSQNRTIAEISGQEADRSIGDLIYMTPAFEACRTIQTARGFRTLNKKIKAFAKDPWAGVKP